VGRLMFYDAIDFAQLSLDSCRRESPFACCRLIYKSLVNFHSYA
jgi:hypothetical protein